MAESNTGFGKKDFILDLDSDIYKSYDVNFEIGHGAYSSVYSVRKKSTGEQRACKCIRKEIIKKECLSQFQTECTILKESDHPNIVKFFEIFDSEKYYYLLMENCVGGSLSNKINERIKQKRPFDENILSETFRQIASSISYLHEKGICHRDLKPDNICFTNMGSMENNTAKLIDFGLGKMAANDGKLDSLVGSPLFVAPEVLNKNYTKKCDIWSFGVILFLIVGGYPPFLGKDNTDTNMKILGMKYEYKEDAFKDASEDVKDLINHCLVKEDERYTIDQVLKHRWICKEKKMPENVDNNYSEFDKNFRLYQKMDVLEKKIIMFIAMRLNEDEVKKFKELFIAIDKDDSGTISKKEFLAGIKNFDDNLTKEQENKIFANLDNNENKHIDYTEFVASLIGKDLYLNKGKLKEVFDAIDINKKGKISKIDVKKCLNLEESCVQKYEYFLEKIGKGKEDEINFDEFFKIICAIIADTMNK